MSTSTVRMSDRTRNTLRQLSSQTGESMQAILERAVEEYRRRRFLEDANAAFAALRKHPDAWAEELEERSAWDTTLGDGVEEENE